MKNETQQTSREPLLDLAAIVKSIIPSDLDAVIILYKPDQPRDIASVMATNSDMRLAVNQVSALERGRTAAKAFIERAPNAPELGSN